MEELTTENLIDILKFELKENERVIYLLKDYENNHSITSLRCAEHTLKKLKIFIDEFLDYAKELQKIIG